MSNEELVTRIQAGERELLLTLWEQIEHFVFQQAARVARAGGAEQEDLHQSGYLALVAAAESYDPGQGMQFIGWLALHLKTAFAEAGGWRTDRKARDPLRHAVSLDAPLSDDGGLLGDMLPDPAQPFEEAEERLWRQQLRAELDKALDTLPDRQRETLRRRFWLGKTLVAIGQEDGISTELVRQQESKGLKALRHPKLSRRLREFIEEQTPYYHRVGVVRFNTTSTSAVEEIVMRRESMAKCYDSKPDKT